jgi:hypothetical protein
VKVFGADHVLMGTDYPFDMATTIRSATWSRRSPLDAKTVEMITGGQCEAAAGL